MLNIKKIPNSLVDYSTNNFLSIGLALHFGRNVPIATLFSQIENLFPSIISDS